MKFYEINPFIRFASYIHYNSTRNKVLIRDCRILYIVSGKAELLIENQHFELKPNSLFYCCAGMQYSLESDGIDYLCLNFDLTQQNNTQTAIIPRINMDGTDTIPSILPRSSISDSEFINSFLVLNNANAYVDSLNTILSEYQTQKIHFHEISSGILKMILVQLHRQSINNSSSQHVVEQIIAFIRANYDKPINNKIFSDMTGYHEYHLNRLFKKYTGTTLRKYLLNIRINEAKKLLLTTDLSMSDIAEKTGFNSNSHFSSCFKENVEFSPMAFRREFQDRS